MRNKIWISVIGIISILCSQTLFSGDLSSGKKLIHHQLQVHINPGDHFIQVTDKIFFPVDLVQEELHFLLHGDLTITFHSPHITLKKETGEIKTDFFGINTAAFDIKKEIPLVHYSFRPHKKDIKELFFILTFEGQINHPIMPVTTEYARGFNETPGIISPEGIYLAGSTFWVPYFNDNLVTCQLEVTLPATWDSICIGKRKTEYKTNGLKKTVWDSPHPVHEIYLVGGQFVSYEQSCEDIKVMAFLKNPDKALSSKYLETTCLYLKMYDQLIGPYPYSKFALVENFWETGYGMPSFTLLGPKIIRFPFILHSSYPHELLHNWWGNSVFVDYLSGNWCEGITVYLADHLIKEQRGQGEEYRRTTLQNYSDYVGKKKDITLADFRARYDASSSAIGYGKSMMVFHMLRNRIGDRAFIESWQHFYKQNRFKLASFDDIRKSFELIAGENLKAFFQQWIDRAGAPELKISKVRVRQASGRYKLDFTLNQIQEKIPYHITIPVAIRLEGQKQATIKKISMDKKKQNYTFFFSARPLLLNIDPQFDTFRRLDPREVPPALSKAFGSENTLAIIPSSSSEEHVSGYKKLARKWYNHTDINFTTIKDSEIKKLPENKTVWIFGWENRYMPYFFEMLKKYSVVKKKNSVLIEGTKQEQPGKSFIFATRNLSNPSQVVVFLAADPIKAFDGLSRKLPHYGKYSYLVFEGDEPANIKKGQWPVVDSPLFLSLSDTSTPLSFRESPIIPRKPLINLPPLFSKNRMMDHIDFLSSPELKGRGIMNPEIKKAADYIANHFEKSGLAPGGDQGTYFQKWTSEQLLPSSGNTNQKIELVNVIGILPGQKREFDGQAVVLCAHYDHLGFQPPSSGSQSEKIYPGADDNASGVSIMLELARYLAANIKPDRSIIFIAFTGEENKLLGSEHYLKNLNISRLNNIIGVINLDTVGRLYNKKLLVIGGSSAREWKFIFMGISYTTGVETELISHELNSSDQVSFIKQGIPAVQLFTGANPDYHKTTDTADKIDTDGLVKVAEVTKEAVVYLSERQESLTVQKSTSAPNTSGTAPGSRQVKTGIMPDFSFSGSGVKVGMVSENSPASLSGLEKGDIIIKLGDIAVQNLKEYSRALSSFKPGDQTTITYMRDGNEYTVKIILISR